MQAKPAIKNRKNQKGFLSVDFLFAMTMAAGLCMMMFAFATTLSMLEISQYVAFSTARAAIAGHIDQDHQMALGKAKFASFTNGTAFPNLAPLLKNGWFEIDTKSLSMRFGGATSSSDGPDFNDDYGYHPLAVPQQGVRFKFSAPIMQMHLPFLGDITDENAFTTNITGLLVREPTSAECQHSMETSIRYNAIKGLDVNNRFRKELTTVQSYQGHPSDTDYFGFEDNGC